MTEVENIARDDLRETIFDGRLPWFVARMATRKGAFCLLMSDGSAVLVETMHAIRKVSGQLWLDVELLPDGCVWAEQIRQRRAGGAIGALTEHAHCSINLRNVLAGFELGPGVQDEQ